MSLLRHFNNEYSHKYYIIIIFLNIMLYYRSVVSKKFVYIFICYFSIASNYKHRIHRKIKTSRLHDLFKARGGTLRTKFYSQKRDRTSKINN
jgi:hypothetical protein